MNKDWPDCKNILIIRPDNMGDLLMSSPAIRALKETFRCKITVLTSLMATGIAKNIPEIDDVITYDLPWIKTDSLATTASFYGMVEELKQHQFDAAVIFSVYSQSALPSALLAYLAGIPKRLAYCRENPYALLTDWVPDKEPYSFIQHQVRRDLKLVATVGAHTTNEHLSLNISKSLWVSVRQKLERSGVNLNRPWLILHAGVSEEKREYPKEYWIKTGKRIVEEVSYQVILTGTENERVLVEEIKKGIEKDAYSVAGSLLLEEFIMLIKQSPLVLSVNTGTVHIAAATGTPVIVLYALSNPQHSPWKVKGKVLLFEVHKTLQSKNEVVGFVNEQLHPQGMPMITPDEVLQTVNDILFGSSDDIIPEMIPLKETDEEL